MDQETLRRLQLMELEALKEVERVCSVLGLHFFLVGGSALGAVRHNGFIPWDDDIDIGFYREEYEVFIKEAPKVLDSKYYLETYETNIDHFLCYGKICINGTTYLQPNLVHRDVHPGIFLDVFAIDAVPNGKWGRFRQKYATLAAYFFLRKEPMTRLGKAVHWFSRVLIRILPKKTMHRIGIWFDRRASRYRREACDCVANLYGMAMYDKEVMPKEYVGTPRPHIFEDMQCAIPEQYDQYLTHVYGNYMEYPPEEERYSKHEGIEIDF